MVFCGAVGCANRQCKDNIALYYMSNCMRWNIESYWSGNAKHSIFHSMSWLETEALNELMLMVAHAPLNPRGITCLCMTWGEKDRMLSGLRRSVVKGSLVQSSPPPVSVLKWASCRTPDRSPVAAHCSLMLSREIIVIIIASPKITLLHLLSLQNQLHPQGFHSNTVNEVGMGLKQRNTNN